MDVGGQGADERALRRARRALLALIGLIIAVYALDILPLTRGGVVFELGIGELLVLRWDDGGDLDWTVIVARAEATGNDTATDPRAQDVRKVELDWLVGPFLELLASVDEVLDTSRIDVATRDGSSRTRACSSGFDLSAAAGSTAAPRLGPGSFHGRSMSAVRVISLPRRVCSLI